MSKSINTQLFIDIFEPCCRKHLLKLFPSKIYFNKTTIEILITNKIVNYRDIIKSLDRNYFSQYILLDTKTKYNEYINNLYKKHNELFDKINKSDSIFYKIDDIIKHRDELVDMIIFIYQNIDYKKMLKDME